MLYFSHFSAQVSCRKVSCSDHWTKKAQQHYCTVPSQHFFMWPSPLSICMHCVSAADGGWHRSSALPVDACCHSQTKGQFGEDFGQTRVSAFWAICQLLFASKKLEEMRFLQDWKAKKNLLEDLWQSQEIAIWFAYLQRITFEKERKKDKDKPSADGINFELDWYQ